MARLRAAGCVFAEAEATLLQGSAADEAELESLLARRVAGAPLEHLLGWVDFAGLRLAVAPGVFVPRRRTELMVAEADRLLRTTDDADPGGGPVVVELCCGAAAAGTALAGALHERGLHPEVHACDVDPAAVACARKNLARVGGTAHEGDLDAPLPHRLRGRVHVLLANAPYVPTDEISLMPVEARLHEHRVALDGGHDGLDVQRRVIGAAPDWLAPGGHLLVETAIHQAPTTAALMRAQGLAARVVRDDELDATVVVGTLSRSRRAKAPS
ncbi:putative protein N(5)-glutamine methyltransferase [Nocardioides pacificus]